MTMGPFQHIDLRVGDMSVALPFYSTFLPELGFVRTFHSEGWKVFATDGQLPHICFFAITEERAHRANSNRIAFAASSPEEVDRLAAVARSAGARGMNGPRACPEYSSTYYAAFFNDPSGNRLEICFRTD